MSDANRFLERTGFQESNKYNAQIDLQTDFVMVYGIDNNMPERVKTWKEKGYVVHLMTGIAWGNYQDYLDGRWDGKSHMDEGQRNCENHEIGHGYLVPYMVPTVSYSNYLTEKIKYAVDAGVDAIHLEEPESWVESGYSDAFKREWEIYYKEPWQAPHLSVDGQYRASKLKAYLYTRCLDRLCSALKEYAKVTYNRAIRFYVSTHSLINYTQWRIVSPESKLLDLPSIDGYIAQIWTGTSREKNIYHGIRKERPFETAFLEYGIMQELVRGTGRKMWFLHDPIEDNPRYTWKEYKRDYIKIVTASLLHPAVSKYEVCPWPNRVFNGKYPSKSEIPGEKIPSSYSTMLLNVMHTLENMDQKDIHWEGNQFEIGVLLADSAMYQRNYPQWFENDKPCKYDGNTPIEKDKKGLSERSNWSSFFGIAMPLLKYGLHVRPVQLDNAQRFTDYLNDYSILLLSYEFMKPESPALHYALAKWVNEGGSLIYIGDGSDLFHGVREWWNSGKSSYANPAAHLFEILGLNIEPEEGFYNCGKGSVTYLNIHPSKIANSLVLANKLRNIVKDVAKKMTNNDLEFRNSFILHRGPYIIASVMDESVNSDPCELNGRFVNLFEASLPVVTNVVLNAGEQALLYDLSKTTTDLQLIAASSRIEDLKLQDKCLTFLARGPEDVAAYARFKCHSKPVEVTATQTEDQQSVTIDFEWGVESSTILLQYQNHPAGLEIKVKFI